uniref:MATH domain-containing protein n=1 Tax=Caenorhabditis tropicalis TaxID=1561998 RepID=A0A1I7TMI7_9PELO
MELLIFTVNIQRVEGDYLEIVIRVPKRWQQTEDVPKERVNQTNSWKSYIRSMDRCLQIDGFGISIVPQQYEWTVNLIYLLNDLS